MTVVFDEDLVNKSLYAYFKLILANINLFYKDYLEEIRSTCENLDLNFETIKDELDGALANNAFLCLVVATNVMQMKNLFAEKDSAIIIEKMNSFINGIHGDNAPILIEFYEDALCHLSTNTALRNSNYTSTFFELGVPDIQSVFKNQILYTIMDAHYLTLPPITFWPQLASGRLSL